MDEPPDTPGRDWARTGLVAGCLLAAVALALLMPAFAVDGLAGSPLERILPGESAEINTGAGGAGGQLGALNPGAGTGVGGEIGLNSDTFGTTDTEVHFTVESSERTYWRTAAYGTYTGSGWQRSTESQPVDGAIDHPGPNGERIEWELTLKKAATAVPTAYRPAVVEGVENPRVTDNGAIQPPNKLGADATISGVSYAPQNNVDRLRSTAEVYPDEIEQRFTQLPDSTPDRVARRTAQVFENAEADDPYEKAVAVQEFLRSSKEYSLDVGERDSAIADTFIFEMEAGYCEYFATSMAVMLRSQGLPARYVVGYSSGQQVGPNTYEVRGMNAHAWVEVYFQDIGWVRFDPTPGNERLQTQQEALSAVGGEFDLGESGSPGEQFTPNDQESTPDDLGLSTTLNRTAVPGTGVELTVTYNGEPVPGVEVLFNGESVGITDDDGTVAGVVPDAEELTVTVQRGDDSTPPAIEVALFERSEPATNASTTASTDAFGAPGGAVAGRFGGGSSGAQTERQPKDTHPIERTPSIVVNGEPAPGSDLLLTARIGDVVIDDATVTVNGDVVGTTDDDGQLTIALPNSPGDVTIAVERGPLAGQRTVRIPELTMTVDTGVLGANALGSATVTARLDGDPVTGVPVFRDGEEVAVTGPDGRATVDLPWQLSTTLAVEASGQRGERTLTGLVYVPAALGSGVVAVSGLFAALLARRGVTLRRIPARLGNGSRKAARELRRVFVVVVTDGDRYVGRLASNLAGLATGRTTPAGLWLGLKTRLGSWRSSRKRRRDREAETTVREAWNRFLDAVTVSGAATHTPGELADHAIEEDDMPAGPVTELRDTFREVEYGSRQPSDRLQRVQEAIEEIEREGQQ